MTVEFRGAAPAAAPAAPASSSQAPAGEAPEPEAPDLHAPDLDAPDLESMTGRSAEAAEFLKSLAHEGRLMILCHLSQGEKTVGELEELLGSRQSAVSQQLARLRQEGMVRFRREGKTVRYKLADPRAEQFLRVLHDVFCAA